MKHDKEIKRSIHELIIHLLAAFNGGTDLHGRFRALVQSETAMLAVNIRIQEKRIAQIAVSIAGSMEGLLVERLQFTNVYCMHVIPIIDHEHLSKSSGEKAKALWPERNAEIIKRNEKGGIVLIPTTTQIKNLFAKQQLNETQGFRSGVVRISPSLEMMIIMPSKEFLDVWSQIYKSVPENVGNYDSMRAILERAVQSFELN